MSFLELIEQWFTQHIWNYSNLTDVKVWFPSTQTGSLTETTINIKDLMYSLSFFSACIFLIVLVCVGWKMCKWLFGQFANLGH